MYITTVNIVCNLTLIIYKVSSVLIRKIKVKNNRRKTKRIFEEMSKKYSLKGQMIIRTAYRSQKPIKEVKTEKRNRKRDFMVKHFENYVLSTITEENNSSQSSSSSEEIIGDFSPQSYDSNKIYTYNVKKRTTDLDDSSSLWVERIG